MSTAPARAPVRPPTVEPPEARAPRGPRGPRATRAHWSTSSFGEHARASRLETRALREHLDLCSGQNRRWFRMRCGADATVRFIAAHLVTTLVALALVIVLVYGVL